MNDLATCVKCGGYAKRLPEAHTTTRTQPVYRCTTCGSRQQLIILYSAQSAGYTWYTLPEQGT